MQPELPYNQTEGYVTRHASMIRASDNVRNGTAIERQTRVLNTLLLYPNGVTWVELGHDLGLHHGQISATLSVLHQAGKIFCLRETRSRCHPYVHSAFRDAYPEQMRYDEPVKTTGRILRERIDEATTFLENAMLILETQPVDVEQLRVFHAVQTALAILNGERNGEPKLA